MWKLNKSLEQKVDAVFWYIRISERFLFNDSKGFYWITFKVIWLSWGALLNIFVKLKISMSEILQLKDYYSPNLITLNSTQETQNGKISISAYKEKLNWTWSRIHSSSKIYANVRQKVTQFLMYPRNFETIYSRLIGAIFFNSGMNCILVSALVEDLQYLTKNSFFYSHTSLF